ncbi:MAG: hypothetical protein HQL31_08540 [Planctomycetes bacterium]|nr:hypothetical protein [Planctomycetota bacterium]
MSGLGAGLYPPEGRILHMVGETKEDIDDYTSRVCAQGRCPMPAGASFHTNLSLIGIDRPNPLVPGDGEQDLMHLEKAHQDMAIHVALHLQPPLLGAIVKGRLDPAIDQLAEKLSGLQRPVYLRIGCEFDAPHSEFHRTDYIEAYRRIVQRSGERGAHNIAYVWHSYAWLPTYEERDPLEWYPGDAFWPEYSNLPRLLEIARQIRRPVMICEASPLRITPDGSPPTTDGQERWNKWFVPFFHLLTDRPEIRAFIISNCDWNTRKLTAGLGWGDCRIASDPLILDRWCEELRREPYLHGCPGLYGSLSGAS